MNKVPITIIDKTEESIESISKLLKNVSDLEIILSSTNLLDLEKILQEKIPCVVLLGPSFLLEDIEKILRTYNSALTFVKIVFLVREPSAMLLKKAIKLNIYDVLEFPFTYDDLRESINRMEKTISELTMARSSKLLASENDLIQESTSKIVMVFSTKGGSGKSFIACNLALDLQHQTKKRVSLFDLNYLSGDDALILNLDPKNTIYDIASMVSTLDTEMLSSLINSYNSGLKVIPAPINPMQAETISNKATMKIIDTLAKMSDFIVIDAPSFFSDNVLLLLEKTDYLCLVASMDVPSIKNLKMSMEMMEQMKLPKGKVFIIINRANTKVGITMDEVEAQIKKKVDVSIPSDRIVPLTINKGTPLINAVPRSPVSKSINKLTKLIQDSEKINVRK
jgi:pilus assembly protein CpaE